MLKDEGFIPSKRLGQNFLKSKTVSNKIIKTCSLSEKETVLEIGSGKGILTFQLAKRVKNLFAIEKDKRLVEILKEKFKGLARVKIIEKDILKFEIPKGIKVKVIGNIPFYLTGRLLRWIIRQRKKISCCFLTLQKEVALRICAQTGESNYSLSTCIVQYYMRPKILFFIKKNAFSPQPKVDAAFVKLQVFEEPPLKAKNEKIFFRLITVFFQHRRKAIKNTLRQFLDSQQIEILLHTLKLNPLLRPQDLSLKEFIKISDYLSDYKKLT